MYIQITIDGPSGVGKSTLAKALAKSLNYLCVNSGFIFRGLAWYFIKNNVSDEDIPHILTEIAKRKNFYFDNNKWFLNNEEVPENELINQNTTKRTALISTYPQVRNYALIIERQLAQKYNIIMEGRDIGSAVFPDAILKIYLTANEDVRSERRYKELKKKGLLGERTVEDIKREILARDKSDMERELAPLTKPEDAFVLYSDNKSVEELVEEVTNLLKKKTSN